MVQVYLLLVVTNVLAGATLSRTALKLPGASWQPLWDWLDRPLFQAILGGLTFLSGFLGLLFVLPGDQLFVGDLLPSVTALLAGTLLVLAFYRTPSSEAEPRSVSGDLLEKNRVLIGLLALTSGLIHFAIPGVLIL